MSTDLSPAPVQPAPVPPATGNDDGRGSLWLGFGLAWAALAGGYFVVGVLASALASAHGLNDDATIVVLVLAPWLLMLGLIIWFAAQKRPRTALGVGVGIASIVGVALLLVAACFGLLSSSSFR
jgi:hypothetical protein